MSCGQTQLQEQAAEVQFSPGMFSQFGTEYHIGDFVYVLPKSNPDILFDLAQVKKIRGKQDQSAGHVMRVTAQLSYLGRVDKIMRRESKGKEFEMRSYAQDEVCDSPIKIEMGSSHLSYHFYQRHLFLTDISDSVDSSRIAGKFFVIHKDSTNDLQTWLAYNDHFYVSLCGDSPSVQSLAELSDTEADDLEPCLSCYNKHLDDLSRRKKLLRSHEPLRGLELFAGLFCGLSAICLDITNL